MKLNSGFLDEIVDELLGSCQSLDDVLDGHFIEIDDLSMKDLGYIDDAIFNCDYCGWWCELSEISIDIEDGQVCMDCEEDWK